MGNQVLDKRSEGLVQNLNKSLVFVDKFEPKSKNPSLVSARRFTLSMTSISMPVTVQQNTEPVVIQLESEDDVFSSIQKTVHIYEQNSTMNDLVTPSAK